MGIVRRIGDETTGTHLGTFDNYSALVAAYPTAAVGTLAYCENSEGTKWLPGSLGGTFYSKGTYCWNGTIWDSSASEIAEALQTLEDSRLKSKAVSVDTTAEKGDLLLVTTGAEDKTIELPMTPIKDDVVGISKKGFRCR